MATRVSISKLCRGCMCVLENQENSCPNCGFDKNNYPVDKKKLRVDFILKGQYLVGNSLNSTPYENTYIAWNLNQDSRVVVKEFLPSGLAVREDYSTGNVIAASDECVADFKTAIDDYISKAEIIMSEGGKVEIEDAFRENGTAYYVMPAEGEDEHYRLMAFTYVDGQVIDNMVAQARPRKPERVFVQPARSSGRGLNYGSSVAAVSSQPVYVPEPEPYIPRGTISAHVVPDNRIEYKPEVVLPSLHESNREAKEREREKELERKIEKRIEERLEKQLEERIEKQMVRSNGVFSINSDLARQSSDSSLQQASTMNVNEPVSVGVQQGNQQGNPGTIQGDRRSAYTSLPPMTNVASANVNQTTASNQYRGVINVNGRTVDSMQPNSGQSGAENKKFDKAKLSEIKIAGISLPTIASIAICAVIIILVITTLVSKNDDNGEAGKGGSVNAADTSSPNAGDGADETPVVFANAQFESAVRKSLELGEDEVITASYIASVEKLDLSGAGLEDISDISQFTGLKELNLSKNKLTDINALAQLTNLTRVDLGNCKLSDVGVLSGLANLEYVNLVGNSIKDYTVVDNVKLVKGRYCKFYFTYVYHREDNRYDGYSLWSWHGMTIGGEHEFVSVPDGAVTTTVEYFIPITEVGFKIKYGDWVDGMDIGYDRWVSLIQNRYEEQITIHIYNDQEKFQIVYSDGSTAEYGVREADKEEKK